MVRRLCLSMLIAALAAAPAPADWSENVRLTYRGFEISPQVIARNDTVHVVWFQMMSNNIGHVSYIRSTDGGQSWGPIVDLDAPNHWGNNPTLNLAERGLLVSWFDFNRTENISSIAISKSTNGSYWSAPSYVWTENPNRFGLPVSAVKGDSIFLVYFSNRRDSTSLMPFKALHSYDYGATWSDEVTVGHPYSVEALPARMMYCLGTLLFAYSGNPDSGVGGVHVIGHRSTDAGRTWSDTIWISPNTPDWSLNVCLSCNIPIAKLATSYMDFRYYQYAFHGDIFVAISDNEGLAWPHEYQATNNHTAWWPQMDFVADTLISVWSDMRYFPNGSHELVLNRSNDAGQTWLGEERITNTQDESYVPWISFNNGKIHVVWREEVGGQESEIFYKRFTTDSTVGIIEPDISPPAGFSLSAYPNPFNSSTTITVSGMTESEIDIYDITGRLMTVLSTKDGRAVWDAGGLSSGVYFARVSGDGDCRALRLVLLK